MTCLTLVARILPLLVADLTLTAKIFAFLGDADDLDDLDDDKDGHLTWSWWPPEVGSACQTWRRRKKQAPPWRCWIAPCVCDGPPHLPQ